MVQLLEPLGNLSMNLTSVLCIRSQNEFKDLASILDFGSLHQKPVPEKKPAFSKTGHSKGGPTMVVFGGAGTEVKPHRMCAHIDTLSAYHLL